MWENKSPRKCFGVKQDWGEITEKEVVVTGGTDDFAVSVYNKDGFVKDLPSLNQGRSNHGCGHFVNTDNKVVRQY